MTAGGMAMQLTLQQREVLKTEEAPRLIDPETNTRYVLVREDVYERMRKLANEIEEIDPSFFEVEEIELFDEKKE
jgi:hypothetical protein